MDENNQRLLAELQEPRFATIFRLSPLGICITTLEEGTFLDANPAFLKTENLTLESILGRTALDLGYWRDPNERQRVIQILKETGSVTNWEMSHRHKDGTIHCSLRSLERITLDGRDCILTMLTDITDRKRAEEMLAASEARFRAIVEHGGDAFFLMDANGAVTFASPPTDHNLGYADQEFLGRSAFEIVHPDDQPTLRSLMTRLLREPITEVRCQLQALHRNGSWRWLDAIGCNRLADPNLQSIVVNYRDITDRKRIEESLHASEARYRLLADNTDDFVCLSDTQENRLYVSPSYIRVTGWTLEEMQRNDWRSRLHPDELPMIERTHAANLTGETTLIEHRILCKDGSWIWVELSCKPLSGPDGRVSQFLQWSRDITARKRIEQALHESNERFQIVAKATNDAVWDWNFGTSVGWWNDSIYALFGYTREQKPPESIVWNEHLHPEDRDRVLQSIQAVVDSGGQTWTDEYRIIRADGSVAVVFDRGFVLRDATGKAYRMIGAAHDITERKREEQELARQRTELQMILDAVPALIFYKDRESRFVRVNRQLAHVVGIPAEVFIGKTDADLGSEFAERYREDDLRVMTSGQPIHRSEELLQTTSGDRWLLTDKVPYRDSEGQISGLVGLAVDITERKQSEALLNGQNQVLELIAAGVPLTESLTALLRVIEEQSSDMFCSILLLDADGIHLRHGAAPSLPPEYRRAIDGVAIGPCVGSCGTAAFRCEPVIVADIATDPLWADYRDLALRHGLRACWSTPIFDAKRGVLGTFAVYYSQPARPNERQLRLIETVTHTAAIAISRHREEEALHEAKETLRASQQRFATVFRSSPVGICVTKLADGTFLDMNDAFLKIVGYTREEMLGHSSLELNYWLNPEDRTKVVHALQATGSVRNWEMGFQRKDGTIRDSIRSLERITFGGEDCILTILEDITERKQAEVALATERQLLRTMADNLPALVFLKDTERRYRFVNLTHVRQLGFDSEAEMLGKTVFDIFPADIACSFDADDQTVIQAGQPVIEREELFENNGKPGWFLTTKVPLRDAQGQITGLVGIALDITARKQIEAALADERNLLRTLVDHIPDFIFVKDTESRQLLNNAANLRLVGGRTDTEIIGKTVFDFYPREQAQRYFDEDQRVLRSGQAQLNQEESILDQDGQEHWLLSSKIPLRDVHGKCIGLVGIKRDITEHRRANLELAASRERLAVLSRQLIATQESERRHLARELHDEIGQALTGIKLNLKALQQPARTSNSATLVTDTIAVVDQTLQQVRSLALDLRPSMLDDIGLVAALRWCLDRQTRQVGFVATFVAESSDSHIPPDIATACFRVAQESLTNIARHAHARNVRVELHHRDAELELLVRDDGCGFDVAAARDRAARGNSLGLLGMEERVQIIGGKIRITSSPPDGATIHAWFPLTADSS